MDNQYNSTDWLNEVLEEVGLQQFQTKLTNDLQLTKLSHFDFVSESDLIQLGLSKPAAKRLLAAIRKRKSFVTALKNKIVNKLIPLSTSSNPSSSASSRSKNNQEPFGAHYTGSNSEKNTDYSRLTCLINSQDVQIKEEIGHGVHGFVKKGEWTTPNGRVVEVALKILKKDVMAEPGASFNDFVKEISVMHQLNHPNIIKLYGVVLSSPMMMVTELAPFGNLRDRLRKENGSTPVSQLINFGVQIASGMEYLESRRFVHRDLAARNIFISHGRKILIGDLGLMRVIPNQEDHYVMNEKTKIPYPWCAPESLRYKQFSSASDVYMFGVTLWEMFSFGKEPWTGLSLLEILENISTQTKRMPCPKACPAMVYQTLLQCWNTDPSCRPNFSTLYQYLSTSYPLEVRATQQISETGIRRSSNGRLVPNDINETETLSCFEESETIEDKLNRNILNCQVDDRILVIDGQPEKYWWKGQNQRTFDIGWFPLCSTRWMAPKKGTNYVSRPIKNNSNYFGYNGKDSLWAGSRLSEHTNQKSACNDKTAQVVTVGISNLNLPKSKTKSRISKLFGIHEFGTHTSTSSNFPHSYQKFSNESYQANRKKSDDSTSTIIRSQSDELKQVNDEGPPLIDLSDEMTVLPNDHKLLSPSELVIQKESLIDMDSPFNSDQLQRHSSDTRLNQLNDSDNYHLSWAGSWNTGTFDGSNGNIYSNYYCPHDAAIMDQTKNAPEVEDQNRYYSAVSHDEEMNPF